MTTTAALYRVDLRYACFGVAVGADGRVQHVAPIARWMVGLPWSRCAAWVAGRGGTVRRAG